MLTIQTANKILTHYADSAPWGNHCRAVAKLAGALAEALSAKTRIDVHYVRRGALLHDIGRYKTHHPVQHGIEGYLLLNRLALPREAFICASHILFGLDAESAVKAGLPGRDFIPHTIEEKLVPLADFLVQHDRGTTLDQRFASLRKRNSDHPLFLIQLDRAEQSAREFHTELDIHFAINAEQFALKYLPPLK